MYRAVQALLQVATETSEIAALPARLTAFVTLIATIDDLDRAQNIPTRGKVDERNARLDELIDRTLELARYAASYAREHALHDLEEKVNVSAADFRRLRVTRRPGLAQQVHDALGPYVAQLAVFGVTADTLTAHQALIDEATAALARPRVSVVDRHAATVALAQAFAEADELLESHIDALLFPLRKTSSDFYVRYRSAREVLERPGALGGESESPTAQAPAAATSAAPAANSGVTALAA